MKENTALSTIDQFQFPSLNLADQTAYDAEEFDDIALEFPRVKIPTGGGTAWEIPNPEDPEDPMVEKTLEGVIVMQHTASAYWQSSDVNNTPPDCSSQDGVMGYGDPGGVCANCPLNSFGSGEGGKGKACKNMKNIYLLRNGDMMPLLISMPPTSLKSFRQYANNIRLVGLGLSGVKTIITLKKQDGDSGPFSVAVFKNGGRLTPELQEQGRRYARSMREQHEAQKAAGEAPEPDYNTETPAANIDPETGEISEF